MATSTLPESMNFLNDAAHLLAKTAPETSSYMMSRRNFLMFNNGLEQSDLQRQHVCGSCGNIMIPGQGSLLKLEADKLVQRKSQKNKNQKTKGNIMAKCIGISKVYDCGKCGKYTKVSFPPAPAISRRRTKGSTAQSAVPVQGSAESVPPKASANANSKKRAKNRKQGLQALLQQNQSSMAKAGPGLSLADFMKK